MASEERGRMFGFEVRHEIPSEVSTPVSHKAKKARAPLQSAGFDTAAEQSRNGQARKLVAAAPRLRPVHMRLDARTPTMFLFRSCPHTRPRPSVTTNPANPPRTSSSTARRCAT